MSNENIFKSICWDITSKCNDTCKFCYRNTYNMDLSLDENKKILKKMIDYGVDKISFVGGEPLLYENIFELLKYGKEYASGKTLFSITTNAILLTSYNNGKMIVDENKVMELVKLVDWITFSLDAPNTRLQTIMGRNDQHFERVLLLINYLNKISDDEKVKIKINTIVSKVNYEDLKELCDILLHYKVERWKIFRFLPSRGSAKENKKEYWINEEIFKKTIETLQEYNKNRIKITVNGYDEFDNSYITISSNGMLVVYTDNYLEKVNVLHDSFEDVLNYIDIVNHQKRRADFQET